jgi:hypothetical protein
LYVNSDNETLTGTNGVYTASTTKRGLAFNNGAGANFTDGLAFDRSTTVDATKTLISTIPANLQSLGLGSIDKTEGGLVFHATVSDDLNGDGVMDSNDVTVDKTDNANRILKKNPDNTNELDKNGNVIVIDYYRKYPGQAIKQSPFAFAFNGGNYLPNGLMLASDQSVYVQGNFNNNANSVTCAGSTSSTPTNLPNCQEISAPNQPSDYRLPAAIVADTITALSNECISKNPTSDGVPATQLKCGVPISATSLNPVSNPMAINAAFLSNTDTSNGNYHVGQTTSGALSFSGGVNNYIRLLEDWGNTYALNYTGSMVSLGTPLEYSGLYKSGGGNLTTRIDLPYYNIPFRNLNYDSKFDKNENVPPLTPKASYVQQKNFSRVY